MSTERFYKLVIVFLLLLNIGTLGYLLMNNNRSEHHRPPRGPHRPPADKIIMERLHLSDEQVKHFHELKHEHHSQILEIQEDAGRLHKSLFALLEHDSVNGQVKDSLMVLIQETNLRKEEVTFEHFQKLRKILTEEQKDEFDEFVEDISRIIMGHHPNRKR